MSIWPNFKAEAGDFRLKKSTIETFKSPLLIITVMNPFISIYYTSGSGKYININITFSFTELPSEETKTRYYQNSFPSDEKKTN